MNYSLPQHIDDLDKLHLDFIELVFQESEKRLNESVKLFDITSSRAIKLLSVFIPFLIIIAGYLINLKTGKITDFTYQIPAIVAGILLTLSVIILIKVMWSYNVDLPGNYPSLMLDPFFTTEIKVELQKKNMLLSLSVDLQNKIDRNRKTNEKRIKLINIVLILALLAAFSVFLVFV